MTISTEQSQITVAGTGALTAFQFPFIADSAADIVVIYTDVTGVSTPLTPSQYTLVINVPGPNQLWGIGGTITYPLVGSPISVGTSLTITRTLPLTQDVTIRNQGNFYPTVTEQALDVLEMQLQQVSARGGAYRGIWGTGITYNYGDIVQDGINGAYTNNLYLCAFANFSTVWSSNLASGEWVLIFNYQALASTIGSYLPLGGGTITGNLTVNGLTTITGGIKGNVLTVANAIFFGADPTGATDSTTSIQNAINSLSGGGIVYLPPGIYKYSSLTVSNGVTLLGAGWSASSLSCSSATSTGLTMGVSSGIKDMQLISSVTRTANPYINIQSNAVLLERLSISGYFQGIMIGTIGGAEPVDVQILDCNFFSPVTGAGSYGILGNFVSNLVIDGITMSGPSTGTQPDYGLRILASDTVFVSNTNITKHGTSGLLPASGSNCFAFTSVNSSFDNAGTTSGGSAPSFSISPAGGVKDAKFTNTWFGYSAASFGCAMQPTGSGVVDGIQFTGCEFVNNGDGGLIWGNSGSATVKNVAVTGCAFGGNTNTGIRCYGGASNFSIVGNIVGNYATRGANGYGILIDSGSTSANYLIANNTLYGNTTASLSDGSVSTTGQIYNNAGYNSSTSLSAVSVGASPWTYTAGHTPETHYVRAGTVSSISQDGTQIFSAAPATVTLAPNESYTVTYSALPTVNKKLL